MGDKGKTIFLPGVDPANVHVPNSQEIKDNKKPKDGQIFVYEGGDTVQNKGGVTTATFTKDGKDYTASDDRANDGKDGVTPAMLRNAARAKAGVDADDNNLVKSEQPIDTTQKGDIPKNKTSQYERGDNIYYVTRGDGDQVYVRTTDKNGKELKQESFDLNADRITNEKDKDVLGTFLDNISPA